MEHVVYQSDVPQLFVCHFCDHFESIEKKVMTKKVCNELARLPIGSLSLPFAINPDLVCAPFPHQAPSKPVTGPLMLDADKDRCQTTKV